MMVRQLQRIPANPDVLRWARRERQMSEEEAARELGVTAAELEAVENGASLSTKLFRAMMDAYGRSESVLLMPKVPTGSQPVTDHRSVGRRRTAPTSRRSGFAPGRLVQGLLSELLQDDRELLPVPNIADATEADDPEAIADRERERLKATMQMQRSWKPRDESLKGWRAFLQERGIVVLSKDMPRTDCRGVALTGGGLVPLIIVTTDDSYAGRIFTFFHEYGHLVRRSASYCAVGAEGSEALESWCDSFAAAFLLPRSEVQLLVDQPRYRALTADEWEMEDIDRAATYFRVSAFAMAWRLHDLGISVFLATHRSELWGRDQFARRAPRPDQTGGISSPVTAMRELGTAAGGAIVEALHRGLLDRAEVVAAVGIRGDQISDSRRRSTNKGSARADDAGADFQHWGRAASRPIHHRYVEPDVARRTEPRVRSNNPTIHAPGSR